MAHQLNDSEIFYGLNIHAHNMVVTNHIEKCKNIDAGLILGQSGEGKTFYKGSHYLQKKKQDIS